MRDILVTVDGELTTLYVGKGIRVRISPKRFVLELSNHSLHRMIGEAVAEAILPPFEVLRDPACGGDQRIPLFSSDEKSRRSEYCNVDLLVLSPDGIEVIVEIEEADVTPIQVFGKFLASALSRCFIHQREKNARIGMSDSVLFIQVLDTSKLKKDKTSKMQQWRNIEHSIEDVIPIKGSRANHYRLFHGDTGDFAPGQAKRKELIDCIRALLEN